MQRPKRIWWARPRKLCALERPGGGGRSHRPDRREEEIEYLTERGVWLVVSTMPTRHNLEAYERAGLEWHQVPVESCAEGADALEELLPLLRRELRRRGAIAVHGNRHTDFAAALCAGPRAVTTSSVCPSGVRLTATGYQPVGIMPRSRQRR